MNHEGHGHKSQFNSFPSTVTTVLGKLLITLMISAIGIKKMPCDNIARHWSTSLMLKRHRQNRDHRTMDFRHHQMNQPLCSSRLLWSSKLGVPIPADNLRRDLRTVRL